MTAELSPTAAGLLAGGAVVATYLALVGAGQVLRVSRGLQFNWTYHAAALALGLLAGVQLAPWEAAGKERLLTHLTAATFLLATIPVLTVLNRLLWTRTLPDGRRIDAPRLLSDTTGLLVFAVVLLGVLQYIYDVKVPGLLAGSGVVAIILGFAMQDLLANIFGGLAIFMDKPFKTGDWLRVGGVDARVVEVTWRSTRLVTNDDELVDVPNSAIVKQTLVNFEKPTPAHALRADIRLHHDLPPHRVREVLGKAAASVPGVLARPEPIVFLKEFQDSAVIYEIKVWIEDHRLINRVLSDVRSHAWYAVRREGMEIPFQQVVLHRPDARDSRPPARATAVRSLREHAIFGFLAPDQIDALVRASPVVLFAAGEHITTQGARGESMFLLVRGRCEVRIEAGDGHRTVATLGAGDCLGEMSLLTGDPRTATVVAVDEVEAVELTRAVFTPLVHEHPGILTRLSELLAERQAANERHASATAGAAQRAETGESILRRLRGFFSLGS